MNPIDQSGHQPQPSINLGQTPQSSPPSTFGDFTNNTSQNVSPAINQSIHIPNPPEPPQPAQPPAPSTHSFNDNNINSDSKSIKFGQDSMNGNSTIADDRPLPVVRVLSVRGVEYGMMTITLWIAATSLAGGFISIINGGTSFQIMALPISLLLVCVPVFSFFFLRLKKAEQAKPELRLDPSKRRWSQITQFLAYLTLLINTIVFVYLVMSIFGDNSKVSWGKAIGDMLVILVVAGGILAYYWVDEHRLIK